MKRGESEVAKREDHLRLVAFPTWKNFFRATNACFGWEVKRGGTVENIATAENLKANRTRDRRSIGGKQIILSIDLL